MTTSLTTKIDGVQHRRLYYDDITLVPVDNSIDSWHVPGRRTATTEQLVSFATLRGVKVRLVESSRDGQTTTRLN